MKTVKNNLDEFKSALSTYSYSKARFIIEICNIHDLDFILDVESIEIKNYDHVNQVYDLYINDIPFYTLVMPKFNFFDFIGLIEIKGIDFKISIEFINQLKRI